MSSQREFDIILFGANGFTGQFCADHIARAANTTLKGLKIAIAGRNKAKIEEAAKKSGLSTTKYPIILADSSNKASLEEMCKRTRVVVSVVGPFTLYGLPLVEACVQSGTHYVDSTGEFGFVRAYTVKLEEEAKRKGIFLLSSCAFDSLPSELTNLYLHQYAKENLKNEDIDRVECGWNFEDPSLFSGGTMLSTQIALRSTTLKDLHPLSLMPSCADGKDKAPAEFKDFVEPRNGFPMQLLIFPNQLFGSFFFAGPFLMSGANEKCVRKNNIYRGINASYKEYFVDKSFFMCLFSAITMFVVAPLLAIPIIGDILRKVACFEAGQGPARSSSNKMRFNLFAAGFSAKSKKICAKAKLHCTSDAYNASGILCMETAAALANGEIDGGNRSDLWNKGGVLTPGTVVSESLKKRLVDYGFSWEFSSTSA